MIANFVLRDEKGNSGKRLSILQGEIKHIELFLLDPGGAPYKYDPTANAATVKIFEGTGQTPLTKTVSGGAVTLITSTELDAIIGVSFDLSAADTLALPISSTLNLSLTLQVSTTRKDVIDCGACLSNSAPLVP